MRPIRLPVMTFFPRVFLSLIMIAFSAPALRAAGQAPAPGAAAALLDGVFLVDTQLDALDADPADGLCATAAGACSLRAAIMQANFASQPNTITLPAGVYAITRTGSDDDAIVGDLDIRAALTIQGAGPGVSVIDGNRLETADRVFHVLDGTPAVHLSGMTIRNGQALDNGSGLPGLRGGGILWEDSTPGLGAHRLLLEQVILEDNAAIFGGGLHAVGGVVTLKNSQLRANQAESRGGGLETVSSSLTILDSQVYSNTAGAGGGLSQYFSFPAQIERTQFYSNTANSGGAIHATSTGPPLNSQLTVTGSRLYHNQATSRGGAIFSHAPLTLKQTVVEANRATYHGGGIMLEQSAGHNQIDQATISHNSARFGGGLYIINLGNPQYRTTLENSTLSGNTAFDEGGGIYTTSGARLYMKSVTIANNRLSPGFPLAHPVHGGGVAITATSNITIEHTIIANNVIDNGITIPLDNNCYGNLLRSQGNNLLETSDCVVSGTTVGNITEQDPLLGPLQANGGTTPSLALQAGSPAIDAVVFGSCPAQDQRGVARPFDGNGDGVPSCDMGAFEAASGVSQIITFPSLSDLALVEGSREITATVSSGLPVTFTIQTPAACSIGSSDWIAGVTRAALTLLAKGACTLTASQPGSDTFIPAAPVSRTFQILQPDIKPPAIYLPVVRK